MTTNSPFDQIGKEEGSSRDQSPSTTVATPKSAAPDAERVEPRRVQLSRAKGWKMPPNTVKVDRSTQFGNPVVCTPHGCELKPCGCCEPFRCCVKVFREYVESGIEGRDSRTGSFNIAFDGVAGYPRRAKLVAGLPFLRGKNLACWCPPDRPCHADVLLELANRDGTGRVPSPPQVSGDKSREDH